MKLTDPIATKFVPPARAAHQVNRHALIRRLDEGATSRRLTLVHAPAGYGKSSLLSQWHAELRARGLEVIWLTLEDEESDVNRFADSLMVGIASGRHGENTPLRAATAAIVNRFVRTAAEAIVILDDFQRAESKGVYALLRTLLRLLPPTVHVVISSRDRPNLGNAELAANHELLELGAADLRFSLEETEAVLLGANAQPLTSEDMARLVARTEGWPIAVQMTAISLRAGGDRGENISGFSGPDWQLASYLSEQVLAALPPELETVVSHTSILSQVNGELTNLLCDRADGVLMLEELERRELFIVPLDAEHLTYRYHQLFADILSSRLQRREPAKFRQLHVLASRWFSERRMVNEAVHHALRAEDTSLVAEVLDAAGGWRLIPEGRMEALVLGLAHVPEALIQRFPRLALARVYHLIKQGEMDAARSDYDAFRATIEQSELAPDLWTEVNLVGEVLAEYEDAPIHLEDLLAKEALIRSLPSHDHLMLSNVYESLGHKYCECGWLERALEPIRHARSHHLALHSKYGELFALFIEARVVLAQGRLEEARVILDEAAASIHNAYGPRSDLAANCAAYQAEVRFEQGEIGEAMDLLKWALPHMEHSDGWFEVYASAFAAAVHATLVTNPEGVPEIIERMRSTARRRHIHQLELLADVHTVESSIHAGRIADALADAAAVDINRLAAAMAEEFPVYRQVAIAASLCQIKLRLCEGDHASAMLQIATMERWAQQHGHGRLLITLALLAAAAHELAGSAPKAVARLNEAVSMAMFQGFVGPFLECRRFLLLGPLNEEPSHVGKQPTDRFREKYMRRLRKLLRTTAARQGESNILSPPELQTLKHLDKGYTNKEIARFLGVSPNTVKYRLKSLFAKMGVDSRRAAVQFSREQGLLTGSLGASRVSHPE